MRTVIAETDRLLIRTWDKTDADIERLMRLTRLDGIAEYSISGYSEFTREQADQWIEEESVRFRDHALGKFAVVAKTKTSDGAEPGSVIGISGLFQLPPPRDQGIELNYRYPKIYRGQGYATEAAQALCRYGFENLKLPEIWALIDIRNFASKKVAERLGMSMIDEIKYKGIVAERWRKSS